MKNKIKIIFISLTMLIHLQFTFAGATEDLWQALKEANYQNAINAIAAGADVKSLDPTFGTPLNFASCWADGEVVKALIESKSEINFIAPSNGYTPLMNAVSWGNIEAVKFLIAAGANINIKNKIGQPMLSVAIGSSKLEILKLLVEAGADPNEKYEFVGQKDQTMMNALMTAIEPIEKLAALQKIATSLSTMGVTFPPRLLNAKESDFTSLENLATYFLENGADPNQLVAGGYGTILNQAVGLGKFGIAKALIGNGATFDEKKGLKITDKNNVNALFPNVTYTNGDFMLLAVLSNDLDFIKFIAEKNLTPVTKSYEGDGFLKCDNDKSTSYYSLEGMNLLMIAAEHGNPQIVKYLFEKGFDKDDYVEAKWSFADKKQGHCLMLTVRRTMGFAKNSGNQEVIDIIKSAGIFKE